MANQFLNSGVGVEGSGQYPPTDPGVAYFTLTPGQIQWDNGVNPPFYVDQLIVAPDYSGLVSPAPPCGYSFVMFPQEQGSLTGDGNQYMFSAAAGYKSGSLGASFTMYAVPRSALTITDLSLLSYGSATLPMVSIGTHLDGGGALDQAVPGCLGDSSVVVTIPSNVSLGSGGGLDFNNLPTITVSGGVCGSSGFTFAVIAGALPTGLSLNTMTGAITGTPTESGTYAFTIGAQKVSGSSYCWGSVDYAGYVWIAEGGLLISGTANGPIFINAVRQWEIQRIDAKRRAEARS